jgi:hypothetical protein
VQRASGAALRRETSEIDNETMSRPLRAAFSGVVGDCAGDPATYDIPYQENYYFHKAKH